MVIIDINDTIENIDTGIFQVWTATKCGRPCAISKKSSGIGILCCFVPYNHNTDVCGNMISAKMLAMSPDRTLVNISLHVQRYRLIRVVWRSIDSSMSMDTIRQDRFLEKVAGSLAIHLLPGPQICHCSVPNTRTKWNSWQFCGIDVHAKSTSRDPRAREPGRSAQRQ